MGKGIAKTIMDKFFDSKKLAELKRYTVASSMSIEYSYPSLSLSLSLRANGYITSGRVLIMLSLYALLSLSLSGYERAMHLSLSLLHGG